MKRAVAAAVVLAALGTLGVLAYTRLSRDHEYRELIDRGERALRAGQTFEAIEAFSGALALKPDSTVAYLRRGEAYQRRGDLPTALRDLRAASRLDPMVPRVWEMLGDVSYALRQDAPAAGAFDAYLRLDDRSPRVLYKLGLARYRAGALTEAVSALRQAVEIDDSLAEAHYLLGLCLAARDQPDEALSALRRAIALRPGLAAPRELAADLYRAQGDADREIQQLEALAALDPSRAERQVALGLAYARGGNSELAVITLGRAAERLPNQPALYVALGRVWLTAAAQGDEAALRKAIEALAPIATTSPDNGDALALYGRALLLSGDTERAESVLRRAAVLLPVEPDTLLSLADAAERLDHLALARQALMQHDVLTLDDTTRPERAARIADLSARLGDPATATRWNARTREAGSADSALARRPDVARPD